MKQSAFVALNPVQKMAGRLGAWGRRKSQEIEVVEDQKHGQNDIDNHTGQNYNVEHF